MDTLLASDPTNSSSAVGCSTNRWVLRLTEEAVREISAVVQAERFLDQLDADFQVIRGLGLPGQLLVRSFGAPDSDRAALADNPRVASFTPETHQALQVIPDDPLFDRQWNLHSTTESIGVDDGDIDAPEAWEITTGRVSVVAGVIDSGVDYTHPDLYLNIWINQGEIPKNLLVPSVDVNGDGNVTAADALRDLDGDGLITFPDLNRPENALFVMDWNGTSYIDAGDLLNDPRWVGDAVVCPGSGSPTSDTDCNGHPDDLIGWDFMGHDNDPYDQHGHGTHVAGIIGAQGDNGSGIAGVTWAASIMPLRFLGASGEGSTADAATAINYATLMKQTCRVGLRVLNNSWGSYGAPTTALYDAVAATASAGMLFVAGAGNGDLLGNGFNLDQGSIAFYPAGFGFDHVLSVAASDLNDNLARFSNLGPISVDLAAPGVEILSTTPGGGYATRNGTSMAAPHVSGAVALLSSSLPEDASAAEIRDAILASVDPKDTYQGLVATGGRLNIQRALSMDTYHPRARVTAADVVADGAATYAFTVAYSDNVAIAPDVLGTDDVIVRRRDGAMTPISPQSFQEIEGGARYEIIPPGGSWSIDDNGEYEILVRPGAVTDPRGNPSLEVTGRFLVDIAYPGQIDVTCFYDAVDAVPGNGVSADGQGCSTLRSAIQTANENSTENTLVLKRGTYSLNLAGASEDAAARGDLDVAQDLRIIGSGATIEITAASIAFWMFFPE